MNAASETEWKDPSGSPGAKALPSGTDGERHGGSVRKIEKHFGEKTYRFMRESVTRLVLAR